MAQSRYQRFTAAVERLLLKSIVYSSLAFDPKALDPNIVSEEPSDMVQARFKRLSREEKRAFFDYFKTKPSFPIQIYRKSNCPGRDWRNFKFHYEYDRPDRKSECRRLVLAGFDLNRLKGEYYTFAQLHELRRAHESGLDISPLLDNRFSRFQYKVLVPAMRRGYDLSEFLDPSISAREMAQMYYDVYEKGILDTLEKEGVRKQFDALDSLDQPVRHASLDQVISQANDRQVQTDRGKVIELSNHKGKNSISIERP